MRIVFTGGGTGGHFYPVIAVAEAIEDVCRERTLLEPEFFYLGPPPFETRALLEHDIEWRPVSAGKRRRYASALNVLDVFKTFWGIVKATLLLFRLYPDVIFSTGGYVAFPVLVAARILAIPVVIYDADAKPGRVSEWSSRFARYIALAHPDAASAFPKRLEKRIARTGHPIRKQIVDPLKDGGVEFLHLDPTVPTILVLGGSQGAQTINETLLDALPTLVAKYNIVHQTGMSHLEEVSGIASVALRNSEHAERYKPHGLLGPFALRMASGAASLVISRAGSGSIFEIAAWGIPSILIPIPEDVSHDQTENAFSYARAGACVVIAQKNLTPHVLTAEIERVLGDETLGARMREAATAFARPGAARTIADAMLKIAVSHEPE